MAPFNLKLHTKTANSDPMTAILLAEMRIFGICPESNGYSVVIGDETRSAGHIDEVKQLIHLGTKELKEHIKELWVNLEKISLLICENNAGNTASLSNLLFLNSAKKAYYLSKQFSDLEKITKSLYSLLNTDAADAHKELIKKFNSLYFEIKAVHSLIMREIYRLQLVNRYGRLIKSADISGPWANLDLPTSERMWSAKEDEEYFDNRTRARREQTRYNPESTKTGFYFVWVDQNRNPYSFDDRDEESPYPSINTIA